MLCFRYPFVMLLLNDCYLSVKHGNTVCAMPSLIHCKAFYNKKARARRAILYLYYDIWGIKIPL
jgi:hypothetical protein